MTENKALIIGAISVVAVSAGIFIYYYMKKDTSTLPIGTKYDNSLTSKPVDNSSMSLKELQALATKTGVEKAFSEIETLLHINKDTNP